MKKTLFGLLVVGFFVIAGSAFAQVGMMGWYPQNNSGADASVLTQNASMESALQEIYKTRPRIDNSNKQQKLRKSQGDCRQHLCCC